MLHNLKLLREKHGITQQRLAHAIGVSQQSINKYENHNVEPDISTLIAIADFFHTTVDYLIGHVYVTDAAEKDISLTKEEIGLINAYRFLSPKERDSIHLIMDNYMQSH